MRYLTIEKIKAYHRSEIPTDDDEFISVTADVNTGRRFVAGIYCVFGEPQRRQQRRPVLRQLGQCHRRPRPHIVGHGRDIVPDRFRRQVQVMIGDREGAGFPRQQPDQRRKQLVSNGNL
jgi:hypothetical protein